MKADDKVEGDFEGSRKALGPARPEKDPFEAHVGILPVFSGKAEINAWIREMRGDDFEEEKQQ